MPAYPGGESLSLALLRRSPTGEQPTDKPLLLLTNSIVRPGRMHQPGHVARPPGRAGDRGDLFEDEGAVDEGEQRGAHPVARHGRG